MPVVPVSVFSKMSMPTEYCANKDDLTRCVIKNIRYVYKLIRYTLAYQVN